MNSLTSHVLDVAAWSAGARRDAAPRGAGAETLGGPWAQASPTPTAAPAICWPGAPLEARTYRLTFETGAYFASTGRRSFYPRVEVTFEVAAPGEHHHVPLLLSPFGYSTYRGS